MVNIVIGIVLLVIALILWLANLANAMQITASDAAGNGLSLGFGTIGLIALWVILGALLLLGAVRGGMAPRIMLTAIVMLPLSCAAAVAALHVLSDASMPRSPIATIAVVPPVMMAYAVTALLPSAPSPKVTGLIDGLVWGIAFGLALTPWPLTNHTGTQKSELRRNL